MLDNRRLVEVVRHLRAQTLLRADPLVETGRLVASAAEHLDPLAGRNR